MPWHARPLSLMLVVHSQLRGVSTSFSLYRLGNAFFHALTMGETRIIANKNPGSLMQDMVQHTAYRAWTLAPIMEEFCRKFNGTIPAAHILYMALLVPFVTAYSFYYYFVLTVM